MACELYLFPLVFVFFFLALAKTQVSEKELFFFLKNGKGAWVSAFHRRLLKERKDVRGFFASFYTYAFREKRREGKIRHGGLFFRRSARRLLRSVSYGFVFARMEKSSAAMCEPVTGTWRSSHKGSLSRCPVELSLALRCLLSVHHDEVRGARRGKENTKLVAPQTHKREIKTHTSERGGKRTKKRKRKDKDKEKEDKKRKRKDKDKEGREKEKEKGKREKTVKEKRRSKLQFMHSRV